MRAGRLIALGEMKADESFKVRPLGIQEIWARMETKMVILKTRAERVDRCGADQLCAGIRGGSEAGIYAIRSEWDQLTSDANNEEQGDMANAGDGSDDNMGKNDEDENNKDGNQRRKKIVDPPVVAQLDAENAFYRAIRSYILLQCRYKWPSARLLAVSC